MTDCEWPACGGGFRTADDRRSMRGSIGGDRLAMSETEPGDERRSMTE